MLGTSIDHSTSDEWIEVSGFPDYVINEDGLVQNGITGKHLKWTFLHNGIPSVQMKRDGQYYGRQVCTLMVQSWLELPTHAHFNTPTHLDGNRVNCNIHNLILRPRWFAIAYHKEMLNVPFPRWTRDFFLNETGEVFKHPQACATQYGILQKDIVLALHNNHHVFPGGYTFSYV